MDFRVDFRVNFRVDFRVDFRVSVRHDPLSADCAVEEQSENRQKGGSYEYDFLSFRPFAPQLRSQLWFDDGTHTAIPRGKEGAEEAM